MARLLPALKYINFIILESTSSVWCGVQHAPTCAECVNGYGKNWCSGQCTWSVENALCMPSSKLIDILEIKLNNRH